MTQIVPSQVEIEGHVYRRYAVWSGQKIEPWGPEADLRVIGQSVARVDARAKVTGRAVYTVDRSLPGMLHIKVLRSPFAHARLRRLDTSRVIALPGIHAVLTHWSSPQITLSNRQPLFDQTVRFYGQPVAAVVADDEDTAQSAIEKIAVAYEPLPFVVDPALAAQDGAPLVQPCGNLVQHNNPRRYERGNVRQGEIEAEVVVESEFRTQPVVHQCFEPHCALCQWDGENLTVWTSTQYVHGVAAELARILDLPENRVRVISEAIGGGFGSKLFAGEEVVLPALLALQIGRPVRLALDRAEETIATGHREATVQRIRIGARHDGTLTFIDHRVISGIGSYGTHAMEVTGPSQTLYRCPNVRTEETAVYTNLAPARAFRAPGYTEGAFALESAMDQLAQRLKLDPVLLRRRNEADIDQVAHQQYSSDQIDEAYRLGADIFKLDQPKSVSSHPRRRRGRGIAAQIWGGGGGPPAYAWIEVNSQGSADVVVGSQDIGTGTRTALAQIAAEELGLRFEDVRVAEGDTLFGPYAPASGGSMTVSSVGPAVRAAASQARQVLLDLASDELHQPVDQLSLCDGIVHHGPAGHQTIPLATLLERVSPFSVTGQGDRAPNPQGVAIRTFGVQFAEVEVDIDTGEVALLRHVAVHDCGRVISPRQAQSQVAGGITQGIGYALTEELVIDPQTGIVLNPNLEDYLIPTIADIPPIDGRLLDIIDQIDNSIGVKGLGEPPIIPTAPAVANAIADAIGVRITEIPITRAKILAALRQEGARARV